MTGRFNSPPGWPAPPPGWTPPPGWKPDASWPEPPPGWPLWLTDDENPVEAEAEVEAEPPPPVALDASTPDASALVDIHAPSVAPPASVVPPVGVDVAPLLARIAGLEAALAAAQSGSAAEVIELDDQRVLQDVGIYRYHHPLEDAAAYKERLNAINAKVTEFVKAGRAVVAADMFTFDGSLAKGRKMVTDFSKLMLRAYNAEADNCVRSLRSGNVATAQKRLQSAVRGIEKLGVFMEMQINPDYHALRVAELELTADFQMKVQEERERARQEREELREQRRAEQELAAERERLEKEKAHYVSAMASLRASGDNAAADDLAARLVELEDAIEANDYRTANIRAGYVYVISNVGAFGPGIVKIGMTRRLEPHDRIRELGDASVPFRYDTHALFFSKDALSLEAELHKTFADRRVNFVNERREFFFATPAEVRALLLEKVGGGLLEFTEDVEALEYLQSRGRWPEPSTG